MFSIIFTVCLLGADPISPATVSCYDNNLPLHPSAIMVDDQIIGYYEIKTQQQCLANALPELAKWREQHPKYWIKGWKCMEGTFKDT